LYIIFLFLQSFGMQNGTMTLIMYASLWWSVFSAT